MKMCAGLFFKTAESDAGLGLLFVRTETEGQKASPAVLLLFQSDSSDETSLVPRGSDSSQELTLFKFKPMTHFSLA